MKLLGVGSRDQRRARRRPAAWQGKYMLPGHPLMDSGDCRVLDVSKTGAGLELYGPWPRWAVDQEIVLRLEIGDTEGGYELRGPRPQLVAHEVRLRAGRGRVRRPEPERACAPEDAHGAAADSRLTGAYTPPFDGRGDALVWAAWWPMVWARTGKLDARGPERAPSRSARAMGGEERLAKHRAQGKLDARARIDHLLDPGSFLELGTLVGGDDAPADAIVMGSGRIDGRPVMVAAEDFTVKAGTISRGQQLEALPRRRARRRRPRAAA